MPAGRPRTFEPEGHLPAITKLFWQHGFDGVTLDAAAASLGVSKPTLCKAFGDKEEVFARSLACYYEQYGVPGEFALQQESSFREALTAWLGVTIDRILDPDAPCGCLLNDTALCGKFESGPVAETLGRLQQRTLPVLEARIEQAKRDGELDAEVDTASLAHYLAAQLVALSALSRTDADRPMLDQFVRFALEGVPWV